MQGETDTQGPIQAVDPNNVGLRNSWEDRTLRGEDRAPRTAPYSNSGTTEKRYVRNADEYTQKLREIIETSRAKMGGKEIPWIIAQTSYIGFGSFPGVTSPTVVIEGQKVGRFTGLNQLLQGPFTDNIATVNDRIQFDADWPVHFTPTGAAIVADRWFNVLKDVCTNNTLTPVTLQDLGTEPKEVEIASDGQSLIGPDGFSGYNWVNDYGTVNLNNSIAQTRAIATGGNQTSVVRTRSGTAVATSYRSSGTYQVVVQNGLGLPVLTQAVKLPYEIIDDTNDPTPPTSTTGVTCAEAESGNRSAGTDVQSGGNASGGQYVGGFDGASRYVDITVNVGSAGNYPLTFYYASGESGGYIDYSINGGAISRQNITANGAWNQFIAAPTLSVALNAEANTIRVQGGFRFSLDRICLAGGTTPHHPLPHQRADRLPSTSPA